MPQEIRNKAEDKIRKCYGFDTDLELESMINLFIDGYNEAKQQINLSLGSVGRSVWIVRKFDRLTVYGCFDTEDKAKKYVNNASNFIIKKLEVA